MEPIVRTANDLIELARRIKNAEEPITLDTETNGLFPITDKIVGFSLAFNEDEGYYVPAMHRVSENVPERLIKQIFQLLKEKRLIFHNAKFDMQMIFQNYGIQLPLYSDTMAMAYLACFPKLGLKDIMSDVFNMETKEFDQLLSEKYGKQWKSLGFTAADLTPEDIYVYAIHDVLYTYKLFNLLKDEMKNYASILKLENNLIPEIVQMNMEGLVIDSERLRAMAAKARVGVENKLGQMREIAGLVNGKPFEPNSSRQVAKVLFEDLGLPILKRTDKGAPSSGKEVLDELAPLHEFPMMLKEYRSLSKFISGYLDKIPNIVDQTGVLYANFSSIGAESGRFTCPGTQNWRGDDMTVNLQNQPGDQEDYDVRSCYIAPDGWTFVKADFSQIEYRMMNNLAGETAAIEKFNAGIDFHSATARMMLELPDDHVLSHDERQIGKVLNFGISYGMTIPTIAHMTNHTEDEAKQLYDKYFAALPRLKAYIAACQEMVRQNKAVKTLFGRVRTLDYSKLPPRVAEDIIKKGFNTIVQGSAADILKIAMLRVKVRVLEKWGRENVRMVLTVHDELDFYVRNEHLMEIMRDIKQAMEVPVPDGWCRFVCDVEYGKSWSEVEHEDFNPDADFYQPDKFEGWGKLLPECYSSYLEDPMYVCNW